MSYPISMSLNSNTGLAGIQRVFSSSPDDRPPLERHHSDFGPRRDQSDSWGGGRRGGGGGDWGRRRSGDPVSRPSKEDWTTPLPRNDRLER